MTVIIEQMPTPEAVLSALGEVMQNGKDESPKDSAHASGR